MKKSHLIAGALIVVVMVAVALIGRQMAMQRSEGTSLDDLLQSGSAHLEAGEHADAIADLEAAVEMDPGSSEAHFLLAQVYNQTDELLKAAEEFRTVLALDPENAAAHHNLGVTYYQLQDPSAAVAEFEAALKLDPDDADTHYQLGATYLVLALSADPMASANSELLDKAISEFETALETHEDMPEALIGMGNIYIHQADYEAAVEALQRAIEQVPASPEAYYALGEAYARSGDIDNACEAYDSFLELDPPETWRVQAEQTATTLGCP